MAKKTWAVKDLSSDVYISEIDENHYKLHKDLVKHFSLNEGKKVINWLYESWGIEDEEGKFKIVELTEKVVEDGE